MNRTWILTALGKDRPGIVANVTLLRKLGYTVVERGNTVYRTLVRHLAGSIKDTYARSQSKKARNWAHKTNDPPPGAPKLRIANEKEVRQAQQLTTQQEAA